MPPPTSHESIVPSDHKVKDIELVEESQTHEDNATEEKALVRKIDLFLLPTIWLMYLLSVSRLIGHPPYSEPDSLTVMHRFC